MANQQTNDDKQAGGSPCYEKIENKIKDISSVPDGVNKQKGNEVQAENLTDPTLMDVLLRSGEESRNNPGNIRFHEVSETFVTRFHGATERSKKHAVAEDLAAAVQSWGGRFLDYSEKNSSWFVIDQKRARRKCQQELLRKIIQSQTAQYKENGEGKHSSGLASGIGGRGISFSSSVCSEDSSTNLDNRKTAIIQEREMFHSDGIKSDDPQDAPRDSLTSDIRQTADSSSDFKLGKLFHSTESTSQIFSSTDSVARLFASQSGGTIDLPPLSALGDDGCNTPAREREPSHDRQSQTLPLEMPLQSISSIAQILSSYDVTKTILQSQSSTDGKLRVPDVKGEEPGHETKTRHDGATPLGAMSAKDITAFAESAASRGTMSTEDIAVLAESLARSQEDLIQKLLESVSRAQQSAILAQETANDDVAPERVGLFASREWGNELGPVQNVDFHQLFHTGNRDEGESRPEKSNKTKRDWNALVLQNLQEGIKKTECSEHLASDPTTAPHLSHVTIPSTDQREVKAVATTEETHDQPSVEEEAVTTDEDFCDQSHAPRQVAKASVSARKPKSRLKFVEPTEDDVLLGRGGRTNNNPGNKKYLEVKDTMQARYIAAEKNEKTAISQELADIVHDWGGRFLKLDPAKNSWYEIDEDAARKKCSQSLREINTPEERAAKRARYRYDK